MASKPGSARQTVAPTDASGGAGYTGMTIVTIEEIEHNLLDFLRRVEAGETIVITRADEPLAEIKPIGQDAIRLRPFGLAAGEFTVPDDFNDPLPEEILRRFEGR
jgi:antitoxin (DNA-binding transcriptional repressor) of toxin-antitoxin stability system